MHVPLWLFLTSIFLAATYSDMASIILRSSRASSGLASIRRLLPFNTNFPSLLSSPFKANSSPYTLPKSNTNYFSTTATTANMSQAFLDTLTARRTYYQLTKNLPISNARVQEIVEHAILHVPSSFNSQTTRVLLLFGAEHDKLWDVTLDILKAIVPADQFEGTSKRIGGFKGAAATILFFDDRAPVQAMQEKFAIYADRFPTWATESTGMSLLPNITNESGLTLS